MGAVREHPRDETIIYGHTCEGDRVAWTRHSQLEHPDGSWETVWWTEGFHKNIDILCAFTDALQQPFPWPEWFSRVEMKKTHRWWIKVRSERN